MLEVGTAVSTRSARVDHVAPAAGVAWRKPFYRVPELAAICGCSEDDVLDLFDDCPLDISISLQIVPMSDRRYSWIDGVDRLHEDGLVCYVPPMDALYELHIDDIRILQRHGQCELDRVFTDGGNCKVRLTSRLSVGRSDLFIKKHAAQRFLMTLRAQEKRAAEELLTALRAQEQTTPVVPHGAATGNELKWTPELKAEARAMREKLKGQGVKDFTQQTASAFGVTTQRLSAVLKEKMAKKASSLWR